MLGLLTLAASSAHAQYFEWSIPINGATPSGKLTATADDGTDANGIYTTMSFEVAFTDAAFVDNVGFNLGGPGALPTGVSATCTAGACTGFSLQYGSNNDFSVVNSGTNPNGHVSGFDLGLIFGNNQFNATDSTATVVIRGITTSMLRENKNYDSGVAGAPPPPPGVISNLVTAAKIKNIAPNGESGEWAGFDPPFNPAAAPGPLPLPGAVAAYGWSRRLRRRRRQSP